MAIRINDMEALFSLKPISYFDVFLFAILGSFFVRIFYATWRTFESTRFTKFTIFNKFNICIFGRIFIGIGYQVKRDKIAEDYLLGFILGMLELVAYPFLLRANLASYIGAWLAFKTVHRWSYAPGLQRGFYTRYLIANASIIMIAFYYAKCIFFK